MILVSLLPALSGVARAQTAADDTSAGHDLFVANCSSCHQTTGMGLPNMAPALKDNPIVAGDQGQLINIVLKGPAAVLPADRPKFGSNTMDPFYYKLDDNQVAAILTYVRREFGKGAAPVPAKDVAAARGKIDPNTLNN
ncbi:MAG TPA: cytochrome c [Candidatus Methylacidiphilales bacterium]|nr:cytochrome c [Candidatus Methylacidiphilales bacterium]